jgi:hypothetical protein
MRFRSTEQRSRVCAQLLEMVGLADLWDLENHCPREALFHLELVHKWGGAMRQVAMDFWNGTGQAKVGMLLETLPASILSAIGRLFQCMTPDEIDRWLQSSSKAPPPS